MSVMPDFHNSLYIQLNQNVRGGYKRGRGCLEKSKMLCTHHMLQRFIVRHWDTVAVRAAFLLLLMSAKFEIFHDKENIMYICSVMHSTTKG